MTQSKASFFVDDAAVTALAARVPVANLNSGLDAGASSAPGIGISTENSGLDESLPNWTLLDQFGDVRVSQRSQYLGGTGISNPSESNGAEGTLPNAVIRLADEADLPTYAEKITDPTVDGAISYPVGAADLNDLDTGWEEGVSAG